MYVCVCVYNIYICVCLYVYSCVSDGSKSSTEVFKKNIGTPEISSENYSKSILNNFITFFSEATL